jgi:hypothetical protein
MTLTLWPAVLVVALAGDPTSDKPRAPNPFAPSLPELTKEEEAKLDEIIDRFILADTGEIKGEEAKTALRDFNALGPDATFALIRGLNRAATADQSCPTLVIAKKLVKILSATDDVDLLDFARENIAAGIERSQHMNVLKDLRLGCTLRRNALARKAETGEKSPKTLSTEELARSASSAKGARQKQLLSELAERRGPEALTGLAAAAASRDKETQQLGRTLLDKHLTAQGQATVQQQLRADDAEVRKSAARTAAAKFPALAGDVIDLLTDADAAVADVAHQSLTKISGEDYGPTAGASAKEIGEARDKWLAWWEKRAKK